MDDEKLCVCGGDEKVLRHYVYGEFAEVSPMTPEQRQWCVEEACWAGEGSYGHNELCAMDDSDLARAVLESWNMYVQSHF